MILVDTSVWIDHFRKREPALIAALEAGQVLMHPCVKYHRLLSSDFRSLSQGVD